MAFNHRLTAQNISEVSEQLKTELRTLKLNSKEINNTLLLMEEIFIRMIEQDPLQEIHVHLRRRIGDIQVILSADGAEYDPISELKNWAEESEDYYRTLIIRGNRDNLTYVRHGGLNNVIIKAHSSGRRFLYASLFALLGGIVAGLVMKALLPEELLSFIDYHILDTLKILFLNALGALVVPAVFCAIVTSINSLSSLSDAGRIAGKILFVYIGTTILAILIAIGLGHIFFGPGIEGHALTLIGPQQVGEFTALNVKELLTGIIPANFIAPVLSSDILQVMYLAVISGAALGALGDKVAILNSLMDALNLFFQKIVAIIAACVPFITFISTVSMIITIGTGVFPVLLRLIAAEMIGCLLMFVIYGIIIVLTTGLSPMPFLQKSSQYTRVPFLAGSGISVLPQTVAFCTNDLGVHSKLASFTTSLGATVNMDGSCVHLVLCCMMLARMYGIHMNSDFYFTMIVAVFIISIGASAVQNSSIVSLSSVVVMMGISPGALGMLLGIDQFLDMFRTASNVIGDIAATIIVAYWENNIDKETYLSKNT